MQEKYGFIYIWFDRKYKRYYIGCRWGREDDAYICSSSWMKKSYKYRPEDFKRRILSRIYTNRKDLLEEEYRWLCMIKKNELGKKYYNIHNHHFSHWSIGATTKATVTDKIRQHHANPEVRRLLSEQKKGEANPMKRPEVVAKRLATYKQNNHTVWNKGKKLGPNPQHSVRMKGRVSPLKGKTRSQETKDKLSKRWLITAPDGTQEIVRNLNEYCQRLNIYAQNMRKVADGLRSHCFGYKCERVL